MTTPTPPPEGGRIITGDTVCAAVREALETHLPPWCSALGLPPGPRKWIMLPSPAAAPGEQTPFGVITTPGLVATPTRRPGRYDASWRVAVAVMDRAGTHDATAARARTWAAAIRCALLSAGPLGDLRATVEWASEDYSAHPERDAARTLGGGAVGFDVHVPDTHPRTPPTPPGEPGGFESYVLDLTAAPPPPLGRP